MTKKDLYLVGTKLMGLHFAVLGVTTLVSVLFSGSLRMLVAPAVYLVASFYLIKKTSWCLSKIGIRIEDNSEPIN